MLLPHVKHFGPKDLVHSKLSGMKHTMHTKEPHLMYELSRKARGFGLPVQEPASAGMKRAAEESASDLREASS